MYWIVETEYVAAIVLLLLLIFSKEKDPLTSQRSRLFRLCLWGTLAGIFLNIIGIHMIDHPTSFPFAIISLDNHLCFLFLGLSEVLIVEYVLSLIFEHSPNLKRCRVAIWICRGMFLVYGILVAANVFTSKLFYFNEALQYVRGEWYRAPYILLAFYIVVAFVAYALERDFVDSSITRVMGVVPFISVLIILVQFVFPNVVMSGSAQVITLLVLFVNFQNMRIDTDHLTGLINREAFYHTLDYYDKKNMDFHVIIISLRKFKTVNDKFGQRSGDEILRAVGQYIQQLRPESVACRFSGVEFAVVLSNIGQQEYRQYLQELMQRFREPWYFGDKQCVIRASFADIRYPKYAENINDLVASLEYAVRLAKSDGLDSFISFDDRIQGMLRRQDYLGRLMKSAMAEHLFRLRYQPIYDCNSKRFVTAEALLSLYDRNGVRISAGEFIPLAEQTGLVVEISWWVLEETCRFLQSHRELPLESISVNFSIQQFAQENVANRILATLEEYQVPTSKIKLEITERMVVDDPKRVLGAIEQLRKKGLGIYLDDFGMGYSNLAFVVTLPFECIKMDQSLIRSIDTDENRRFLIESLAQGCQQMGMQVVAEGVETQVQKQIVESIGIDKIQGFYFSKALEGDDLVEFLSK